MTSNSQDEAPFRALLRAAEDLDPPLPRKLLLDLYEIQRTHQYNEDRVEAIARMQERILAEIDREAEGDV